MPNNDWLDTDNDQPLRLRRLYFIWFTYAVVSCLVTIAILADIVKVNYHYLLLVVTIAIACQVVFHYYFTSGRNLYFDDPDLLAPQIVIATLLLSYTIYHTESMRGAMLNLYFSALFFGAFQLNRRAFLEVSIAVSVQYAVLIFIEWLVDKPGFNWTLNLFQWLVISGVVLWFSIIGSRMTHQQQKMQQQKNQLEQHHAMIAAQRDELKRTQTQLHNALAQIEQMAHCDALTGLDNRRTFIEAAHKLLQQNSQDGLPIALCILDIDHFKQVNDRFGHNAGDEVLKRFADITRTSLRDVDLIARYGGEEFIILLPNTDREIALACADRVRESFAEHNFSDIDPELSPTLSMGISHYLSGETIEPLIERADLALYQAKRDGRNRCVYQEA